LSGIAVVVSLLIDKLLDDNMLETVAAAWTFGL
jgi:hypothetical protein